MAFSRMKYPNPLFSLHWSAISAVTGTGQAYFPCDISTVATVASINASERLAVCSFFILRVEYQFVVAAAQEFTFTVHQNGNATPLAAYTQVVAAADATLKTIEAETYVRKGDRVAMGLKATVTDTSATRPRGSILCMLADTP